MLNQLISQNEKQKEKN